MDATLHREAMHIQNSAAGGMPGQRSLLFCARTIARGTSPQIRLLHFESPDRTPSSHPLGRCSLVSLPLPPFSLFPPPFSLVSSVVSRSCLLSVTIVHTLSPRRRPPHHLCSLPLRRGALRVLTPRRMSGVMNFNSFTPRHVGVEGRAGGRSGGYGDRQKWRRVFRPSNCR